MSRDLWILAVSIFGFTASPLLIRLSALPATEVVAGRLLLAILLLIPFWLRQPRHRPLRSILTRNTVFAGVLLGIHFILWTEAIYHTSIASASFAINLSPLFIVMTERFWLNRAVARTTLVAMLLGLLGVGLLMLNDLQTQTHGSLGVTLSLVAALFSALYLLVGEHERKRTSLLDYCIPMYAIGMLISAAWGWINGHPPWNLFSVSGKEWLILLGLAVIPTILGHTAYNYLVRRIPASTLSIVALSEPFLAALGGYLIFAERMTALGFLGGVVSLAGVYGIIKTIPDEPEAGEPQT